VTHWQDDDDDIPLDNPHAERGLCWSCQKPLECSGQPVSTSPDSLIPVCMPCWLEMDVYERIDLAIQFHDRDGEFKPSAGSGFSDN
jgi:hypothetical protein